MNRSDWQQNQKQKLLFFFFIFVGAHLTLFSGAVVSAVGKECKSVPHGRCTDGGCGWRRGKGFEWQDRSQWARDWDGRHGSAFSHSRPSASLARPLLACCCWQHHILRSLHSSRQTLALVSGSFYNIMIMMMMMEE